MYPDLFPARLPPRLDPVTPPLTKAGVRGAPGVDDAQALLALALRRADTAMYAAKNAGRNRVCGASVAGEAQDGPEPALLV